MIDHLAYSVANYDDSIRFYTLALAPVGYTVLMSFDNDGGKVSGFGRHRPMLWIGDGGALAAKMHFAIQCANREMVDAFYAAAIQAGGTDNGAPGLRTHYHPNYYGAFVLDPDGNNVEAVCHEPV